MGTITDIRAGLAVAVLAIVSPGTREVGASSAPPVPHKVTLTVASNGSTVLDTNGASVVVRLSGGHLH